MFERFTEKARRVIFFARYEASQHGIAEIDTRCLLLGILREGKDLMAQLLPGAEELARLSEEVEALFLETAQEIPTSVDMPLSHGARRALAYAAEESQRLEHTFIDQRHLLLGLLREGGAETKCLKAHGIGLEKVRAETLHDLPMDRAVARQQLVERARAWARLGEFGAVLQKVPADRRQAAFTLLEGLASGKFEATGTSRNGPFHFSFDDKTE